MHPKKTSLWEAISSSDNRIGLGYASQSGFHNARTSSVFYPYIADDNFEENDEFYDEESNDEEKESNVDSHRFFNKIGGPVPYDPYAQRKTDRSYHYGSNTPSGMFAEAIGMNRSKGTMSPKPIIYSKKQTIDGNGYAGASIRPAQTITRSMSTLHGWSKSSYDLHDYIENEDDENIENIRKIVRFYHKMNLRRE